MSYLYGATSPQNGDSRPVVSLRVGAASQAASVSAVTAKEGFQYIEVVLEVPTSCRSRQAWHGLYTPVNNRLGGEV